MTETVTPAGASAVARERPLWRQVAVPTEHGGWSLTLEPAVLGLLVAWSWAGLAIGVATFVAFLARTPLKLVLVDVWRRRWLPRTTLATRFAATELMLVVGLLIVGVMTAHDQRFWVPFAIAVPLVSIELWYDMRSRGRRLIPEMAGTIGIGSSVGAIVLADGGTVGLAVGLWVVVSACAAAAIPYARTQVFRTRGRDTSLWRSDLAQLLAVAAVVIAWLLDAIPLAAMLAVVVIAVFNVVAVRRPPRPAKFIGLQQMTFGIGVTVITAIAVLA